MSAPEPLPTSSTAPDGKPMADQPAWRREVPIDTDREQAVNRRDFLRTALITGGALIVANEIAGAMKDEPVFERVHIADTGQLQPGGAILFYYPDDHTACLLVRSGKGASDYVAYEQACTHLQCPVVPQPEQGRLFCPCHQGAFDLATGEPTMGPPRRRLPRITLDITPDGIYATGRS